MFDFQKLEVYRKAKSFHISSKAILSSIKTERFVNDQLMWSVFKPPKNPTHPPNKTSAALFIIWIKYQM
jgi:hypothetical protein